MSFYEHIPLSSPFVWFASAKEGAGMPVKAKSVPQTTAGLLTPSRFIPATKVNRRLDKSSSRPQGFSGKSPHPQGGSISPKKLAQSNLLPLTEVTGMKRTVTEDAKKTVDLRNRFGSHLQKEITSRLLNPQKN